MASSMLIMIANFQVIKTISNVKVIPRPVLAAAARYILFQ